MGRERRQRDRETVREAGLKDVEKDKQGKIGREMQEERGLPERQPEKLEKRMCT